MTIENLCIVQARMGSTRLPGKTLMNLCGKTVLERVLERTAACRLVSETAVVTGIGPENLPIVKLCAEKSIRVFCGSENDVLDRFYQLARLIKPKNIVRITADCPLLDPGIADRVIKEHARSGADYTTNTIPPTFPDGEDVEVLTFAALESAWKKAALPSEREHVTPYIRKRPGRFKIHSVRTDPDLSGKRWTLDDRSDYRFICAVYRALNGRRIFSMEDVLALLSKRPGLEKINGGTQRNEGYKKSLLKDALPESNRMGER